MSTRNSYRFRNHAFSYNAANTPANAIPISGSVYTSEVFSTDGYARICGWIQSDHTLSFIILQGDSDLADETLIPYKDTIAITGATIAEGSATKFSVEVVGEKARIKITNSAGAVANCLGSVNLRAVQ